MLKFLVLFSFSVACVMILQEERKTVVYRSRREFRGFYNRTFLQRFDLRQYNLTSEEGQRRLSSELEHLYVDKEGALKRLFCWPVRELFQNESELQLGRTLTDQLTARLNRTFHNFLSSSNDNQTEAQFALFEATILRSIRSNHYYVYRDQFCTLQDPFFGKQLAKIFHRLQYYVLVEGFSQLLRLRSANENAVIYVVLNEENPNTHCAGADRSRCLNECLKKRRLSKYFYKASERGRLIIDYKTGNRSIAANERACFRKCKNRCKLIVYERYGNESRFEMTTFFASSTISDFSYCINFFGFFFSFFSVSCHKLLMKLARLFAYGVLNKASFLALKTALTFICFVVLLLLSGRTIFEYVKESKEHPVKRHITSVSFVPFDLVICVQVDYILRLGNSGNYSTNHNDSYSQVLSMAELEERTKDAFNATVDHVYLSDRDEHFAFTWKLVEEKVQFYKLNNSLSRCFYVNIEKERPRYRRLLSASKVRVSFKHPAYSMFILARGQSLTSEHIPYGPNNERDLIHKLSTKPAQCMRYEDETLCHSRRNCIDLCVANKSIEQNLNLSGQFVIDKTSFTQQQWANLFIDQSESAIHRTVETECQRAFPLLDCEEHFFKHDRPTAGLNWKVLQIDVNSLLIELVDSQNIFQLLQDLLLLQCVVFNFNVCQVAIIFILFKFHLKQNRSLLYLVYAICLACFIGHNWAVLYQLRNEKLVQSQILEELQFFEMPTVAFCFGYDQSAIAHEHNLTGNDLERLTESINPVAAFRQITFVDKSNREVHLNLSRSSLPSNSTTQRIRTFYFLDKKCLAIGLAISYEPYAQFYFNDEQANVVLKVDFNRHFLEQQPVVSFLAKRRGQIYFSELIDLDYSSADRSYLAEQTIHENYYEDKFRLFKRPLSLFDSRHPNANEYLVDLRERFRVEHQSATLDLPLESDSFDLPINNTLFREFYYGEQYPSDRQKPDDLVYLNQMTVHTISEGGRGTEANFRFSARSVKYIHVNLSENQWCKTILSFLNGLIFYLNVKMFQTFFFKLNDLKTMSDGLLKTRACDQAVNAVAPICVISSGSLPELQTSDDLGAHQPIERRTAFGLLGAQPKREAGNLRRTFSVSHVASDEGGIIVSDNFTWKRTPSL